MERLGELELSQFERLLRSNIRNAWLAETPMDIRREAVNRAAQNKWFEASVLFELACDVYSER